MGLRDRSAAVPREFLHRRRPAVGGVRMDRQRPAHGRRDVSRRPAQRPVRRDQRQSRHRPARPRHPGLAARGVRPQGSRRLPRHPRRRRGGSRRRGRDAAHQWRRRSRGRGRGRRPTAIAASCAGAATSSTRKPTACRSRASRPARRFADIPSAWRCPDCGTDKTTFRPYIDANQAKPALRGPDLTRRQAAFAVCRRRFWAEKVRGDDRPPRSSPPSQQNGRPSRPLAFPPGRCIRRGLQSLGRTDNGKHEISGDRSVHSRARVVCLRPAD